jgi:hypothetical protein
MPRTLLRHPNHLLAATVGIRSLRVVPEEGRFFVYLLPPAVRFYSSLITHHFILNPSRLVGV